MRLRLCEQQSRPAPVRLKTLIMRNLELGLDGLPVVLEELLIPHCGY